MGGTKKEESKKGDKYQPQINELKNRLDKLSNEMEGIKERQEKSEGLLTELKRKIDEISTQTAKNSEFVKVILRAQELLEIQEEANKRTEEKFQGLTSTNDRSIQQEFGEIIREIQVGNLDFRNQKTAIIVTVATVLSEKATPQPQKTFWRLVEKVYEDGLGRGASESEIASALGAILDSTDLLNKMPKLQRRPGESLCYYVFNEYSDFYKKLLALCNPQAK